MSPINKASNHDVNPKSTLNEDDTDEGFVSPYVQRVGLTNINHSESRTSSNSASDNDSQAESSSSSSASGGVSQGLQTYDENNNKNATIKTSPETNGATNKTEKDSKDVDTLKDAVESKAESLAKFIVCALLGNTNGNSEDKVERTLLRCVRRMMENHQILFKGMMKRLQVTRETGFVSFVNVANTLFEEEKTIVTWSRIVALYAFGGQLALYYKEHNMEDFAYTVADFMGQYAKDVLTAFVTSIGGWVKICDAFPFYEDHRETKIRCFLLWTAFGLGVSAIVSYLDSC